MILDEYKDMDLLVITPNHVKLNLLKNNHTFLKVKYMTKEEYKSNYFFSYDNKTISYLINKYGYNLDICRVYLNSLYLIDLDKDYKNAKLIFLKNLKKELIDNNLLYYNLLFRDFVKNKKVIVYKYLLDKYEEDLFSDAIIIKENDGIINSSVYKCNLLEDELLFVIENISNLIDKGVSLSNIYITNIGDNDLYLVNKMFNYFNIPINLDMKESIYGTKFVKKYLSTKKIPVINNDIVNKLIGVINSLVDIENDPSYDEFLIDKLKHTYLSSIKYKNAVNVINMNEIDLSDDDYLFVIGFNQDLIPKTFKDEEYLSDNLSNEINIYTTNEKNKLQKEYIINILSSVKNLILSYRKKDSFNTYLKSSLIEELNLKEIEYNNNKIYNSNIYNKLILGESLDNYYKYGEISNNLNKLYSNYDIKYNSYDNKFKGIDNNKFLAFINNKLKLSYTSINSYNNCAFKYYLNYILKIDKFSDTFSLFIGNLFHHIFEVMDNEDFNFEKEWDSYLEKRELSLEELFLLRNLKNIIIDDMRIIKEQNLLSTYHDSIKELEVDVKLDKEIDVTFTGKIDKVLYKRNVNDTYFSLIDYKTGGINTSINNIKYGLDMQLPIYLYLISKSNYFDNPIFTGIYFQRVLHPSIKWEKNIDIEKIKKDNLKLMGYSTDDRNRLYEFDKSYEDSELIKSMKTSKDSSFSRYSKLLSDDDIYNLVKYTEKEINKSTDKILEGDFSINPKVIDKKKSCEKCNYKDICFVTNKDYKYLDKINNLDFLGGDENGLDS